MPRPVNNQVRHKFFEELEAPNLRKIQIGDMFAYKIGAEYRFVRVIRQTAKIPSQFITYWYSPASGSPTQIPPLRLGDFLVNPAAIAADFFLRDGFMKKVRSEGLSAGDIYPRHCLTKFCLADPWEFEDEFGVPLDKAFQPIIRYGHPRPPEFEIGQVLGLCSTHQEYNAYPYQNRPHYRASIKEQLPHSLVRLAVPKFNEVVAPDLIARYGKGKDIDLAPAAWAWEYLERQMGYSKELKGVIYREMGGHMYVSKRQHETYYRRVEEVMKRLEIRDWYIYDGVLDDWLYGTYKPADYRTL